MPQMLPNATMILAALVCVSLAVIPVVYLSELSKLRRAGVTPAVAHDRAFCLALLWPGYAALNVLGIDVEKR